VKVVAGASAGGHMNQLLRLLDASGDWPTKPSAFVTTLPAVAASLAKFGPVTLIGECDRRHPVKALGVIARAARFAFKERPDVVVTTGSMPLAMVCAWSKLLGARIVWIDSIANAERPSVSGRFVRTFADLFLVQWEDVAKRTPRAEFVGALV
jgi:UDP-N-acetylglucosamine:LPS N-acetylglucosamine transferase